LLVLALVAFLMLTFAHADSGASPPLGPATPAGLVPRCPTPDEAPQLPPDLPVADTASAGAVAGSFAVSPTGEATYTIPIAVPPGRAGMEPRLAVVYDSAAGQDLLGVGFGLQGVSAVTRCPANLAQDGEIRAVRYDDRDHLCLDGARLVFVHEETGTDGNTREYRTFPDRFAKVVAHYPPAAAWDETRGPRSFEVFTRAGRILEYGTTDDSRPLAKNGAVASWWVAEEKDRRGNAVAYTYENDLDPTSTFVVEHVPSRIDYTSGPGLPATRAVKFEYQSTNLHSVYYRAGMQLRRSKLLATIRTFAQNDEPLRTYHFDYVEGKGTRRMLLDAVHACAGDGGTCKPATRFGWSSHASEHFTPHEIGTRIVPDKSWGDEWQWLMADVNGDGLDDIVISRTTPGEDGIDSWYVARNLGGTFATPELWGSFPFPSSSPGKWTWTAVPFDYDQDGRTDIFLDGPNISWATYKVLRAQEGGGFELIDTGISRRPQIPIEPWQRNRDEAHGFSRLGDVDGDGVADLIVCDNPELEVPGVDPTTTYGHARWGVHLWSPDAGGPGVPGFEKKAIAIDSLKGVPCDTGIARMYVADVDGDGKAEIVTLNLDDPTQFYAYAYEGDEKWSARPTGVGMPAAIEYWARLHFLDLNGDGLSDVVVTGQNQACGVCDSDGICHYDRGCDGPVQGADVPLEWTNTGDGYANGSWVLPSSEGIVGTPSDWTDWFGDQAVTIDAFGRGQTDLMMPIYGYCAPGNLDDACWVLMTLRADAPDGGGLLDMVTTRIPFPTDTNNQYGLPPTWFLPKVTDADGDGRQDFLVVDGTDSGHFLLYKNDGPQDLLVSVTTGANPLDRGDAGFLPDVSISYDPLIDWDTTESIPPTDAEEYERWVYNPRSGTSNGCVYPIACVTGNERVVSKVVYNDGANAPRTLEYRYRDGRYHRLGRGFLGFGERIVLDDDTGGGTAELYDNHTFDPTLSVFPFAGQVARAWTWQPVEATQTAPTTVDLSYTEVEREEVVVDPGHAHQKTYFTLPKSTVVTRKEGTHDFGTMIDFVGASEPDASPATVLGRSYHTIAEHDAYGNVLAENTTMEGADASTATTRSFLTDPGTWQIAFVQQETTCSAGLGQTQCRAASFVSDPYGDVLAAQIGDAADPGTQLWVAYGRDLYGNVVSTSARDAYGHHRASCTSYDEDYVFPFARRDAAGHLSLARFDPGLGVPTAAQDPNGLVVQWAHDGFGRVTEELRPDGTTTTTKIERDKDGGPSGHEWEIVTATAVDGGGRRNVHFDTRGRAVAVYTQGPDVRACDAHLCTPTPWYAQEAHYDHLGRLDRVSIPHLTGDPKGTAPEHVYRYDAAGRMTRHTAPWGAITSYDYSGLTTSVTDWTGTASTLADALGRVVETTDKQQDTTLYNYGPFGALWGVVGPDGTVRLMVPDAYGRVRVSADPDRGETVTVYDGFGEALGSVDARGWPYAFKYDAIGRLVERDDHDGTTTWTYDTAPHGVGRIASVTSPTGNVEAYGYDPLSRPASVALTVEGETFTSAFGYDGVGRLHTIAYPQGEGVDPLVVRYDRDGSGNLVAVRDNATGATYWSLEDVDGAGRATLEALAGGATTTHHDFNPATGALTRIVTAAGAQTLQDLRYGYDGSVRLTSRTDGLQPLLGGLLTERFFYDTLDRLTCAAFDGGLQKAAPIAAPPSCALSVRYLPSGNIDDKSDVGTYAYDPQHPHAVAGLAQQTPVFRYDATGNQTHRPGMTIDYTAFDLPKAVHLSGSILSNGLGAGDVTFDYDGNQKRVRKLAGDEETIYAGDLYERVTDASGAVKHLYFIAAGSGTAVLTRAKGAADAIAYVHPDALGSVDVVSDGKGGVLERRSYDAFGARRNAQGWQAGAPPLAAGATALGFTGHEGDEDLGLVNMRGRIYDPKVGRFLQTDPLVGAPLFSQSWNPYSYVWNSPLNGVDPSGFLGDPNGGTATGEDGVTYAQFTGSLVEPGPGFIMNRDTQANSTRLLAEDGKSAARDDTSPGAAGAEPPRDPEQMAVSPPGARGIGGAFPGMSFAQDHEGGPSVRAYEAWHDDTHWGVPQDPSWGTGAPDPGVDAERRAQQAADAVVALSPHSHVHVDHSDEAMAVGKAGLDVAMVFIPEGRIVEGAAESYLLRGTTAGYPGSPALQRIGVTPTTTDPVVATLFATEASRYGEAVVLIAPRASLPTIEGNVLAALEAEVGVELTPLEFAARAQSVSLDQARSALGQLGIVTPAAIPNKAALDGALRSSPRLTADQIDAFLRSVGF
jgi:RHS repeat-associated protein